MLNTRDGTVTEVKAHGFIFISYAWGDGFESKEWVRQHVVTPLGWDHDVFWDRDSIALGESIDGIIARALSKRPILVLCLCDRAYVEAAQQDGRGLNRELRMLTGIVDEPNVRIVPIILETGCVGELPAPLQGRLYLNLQPLHQRGLDIGTTLREVAEGRTAAQLQYGINARLADSNLRERARKYLMKRPVTIWGDGVKHEVTVYREGMPPRLLQPAPWMWQSKNWNYMLNDDNPSFCPCKGRWYWEYCASSIEMRPLATAVLSAFFDQLDGEKVEPWLNQGGIVLAHAFFRMVKYSEPFTCDATDIIGCLIRHEEGYKALKKLLDAADETIETV